MTITKKVFRGGGEDLTDEAREYASKIALHRKRGINHLILIAKQSSHQPLKDQEQTSTIL